MNTISNGIRGLIDRYSSTNNEDFRTSTEKDKEKYLDKLCCDLNELFVGTNLTINQFNAILLFVLCYNMGIERFKESNLYKKIKADSNDNTISGEICRFVYDNQKKKVDLVVRRKEEANLYTA